MVTGLHKQGQWDDMVLADPEAICHHVKTFKETHRKQWEQFARDVWKAGSTNV